MKQAVTWFTILILFLTLLADNVKASPSVEAKAAILVDYETGRILFEKNADDPMPMASTTKIMTALLTLEKGNLSDTVTVSRRAASAPKVKMYLSEGEKIELKTLLYALMLQSSNDAAVAIAEHIGGSVEGFCDMMTDKARELGAVDTVYETPNGLDSGDHHSTAADLALIARHALNNPDFIEIINTPSYYGVSDRREYSINNTNRLLHEYQGANGIKTGFTNKAGHCFVGSAKRDGLWLISVVLASGWGAHGKEQKWVDTKRILNYGFENYHTETIINDGDAVGEVRVERSKTPSVGAAYSGTLNITLSEEEKETLTFDMTLPETLRAPVYPGEKLGVCQIFINGEHYAEVDLIALSGAERHDLKTCMEKTLHSIFKYLSSSEVKVILPEF